GIRDFHVTGVRTCALPIFSQAEYAACVAEAACPPASAERPLADSPVLPAVGLSWQDAQAYAAWLSRRSGEHYRLPRHGEWVLAEIGRASARAARERCGVGS